MSDQNKDRSNSNLQKWLQHKNKRDQQPKKDRGQSVLAGPLSRGQERMYLSESLYPTQPLYHYAHRYEMVGKFDLSLFVEALNWFASRHKILRASFTKQQGQLIQKYDEDSRLEVHTLKAHELGLDDVDAAIERVFKSFASKPFDFAQGPLWRLVAVDKGEDQHSLLLVLHHMLGDKGSLDILHREIATYQGNRLKGVSDQKITEPLQYYPYALEQRNKKTPQENLDFWTTKLEGEYPVLKFPQAKRARKISFKGALTRLSLPKSLAEDLLALAKTYHVTPFNLFLASFKILLSRYTEISDLCVGTPVSNRDRRQLQHSFGFFIETIVLRSRVDGTLPFSAFLQNEQNNTNEALGYTNTPIEEIAGILNPRRTAGINPLFQSMFLFDEAAPLPVMQSGVTCSGNMFDTGVAKFDLTLFVTKHPDKIELTAEHNLEVLESKQAREFLLCFKTLLESIVQQPNAKIDALTILPESSRSQIISRNHVRQKMPAVATVVEVFLAQAKLHPLAVAVVSKGRQYNYSELSAAGMSLTKRLIDQGVQAGDIVGLYVERSPEMVVGIWGILMARAAYLPLDPTYPARQLKHMVQDSGCKLVVGQDRSEISKHFNDQRVVLLNIDDPEETTADLKPPTSDDPAYMIYTSGSTGQPKGVLVTHQNLLHATWARKHFYPSDVKRFLLLSSFSFDSSIVGIFWTFFTGGTLVLPPTRIEQDPQLFESWISDHAVTHTLMLPSLYYTILGLCMPEKLASLEAVILAGEAVSRNAVVRHFEKLQHCRLYNEYGPTEASVWCIACELTQSMNLDQIPLGKPIVNAEAYVLDKHRRPVPDGVIGELHIGGLGVTGGYWKRSKLSLEKFIRHPFSHDSNARLYRTGDRASMRMDGTIDFWGRLDQQIKIRGYRIELGEVKHRLLSVSGVEDAFVMVKASDHSETVLSQLQLVAFVESKNLSPDKVEIKLNDELPEHMRPNHLVVLKEFPKLPNGKTDRLQLQNFQINLEQKKAATIHPESGVEKIIHKIWAEILGVSQFGIDDNFFDLGGDSLKSIAILSRARELGIQIGPTDIFTHQSIRKLAAVAKMLPSDAHMTIDESSTFEASTLPLSTLQKGFYLHHLRNQVDQGLLLLHFELSGPIEPDIWMAAWQAVAQRHPSLRASFQWDKDGAQQKTHDHAELSIAFHDWSQQSSEHFGSSLDRLIQEERNKDFDLTKPGLTWMHLVKKGEKKFLALWTTHHILLDGWSANILFRDALQCYQALMKQEKPQIQAGPSLHAYLTWQQNKSPALKFWKAYLEKVKPCRTSPSTSSDSPFKTITHILSTSETSQLRSTARILKVTENILFQGLWHLAIGELFHTADPVIALTLSGRSPLFPGADRVVGMLMRMLPLRFQINFSASLADWLRKLQEMNSELRLHELDPETSFFHNTAVQTIAELTDVLFIYGNFMVDPFSVGTITVNRFEGDFSTNFPLSIRVNPVDAVELKIRYKISQFGDQSAQQLMDRYAHLLKGISEADLAERQLKDIITFPETDSKPFPEKFAPQRQYVAPQNSTEHQLVKIWEEIMGNKMIGTSDDFFEIGGTSLQAIQLLGKVNDELKKNLGPTEFIQHPTIGGMAKMLTQNKESIQRGGIVPMKTSGSLAPLFCIHSGGAHIFFYQGLARHAADQIPVYAIQPKSFDTDQPYHASIEMMAAQYIKDMQSVQGKGPYRLLGTCFSNAVVLEMSHQLQAQGEFISNLIVVDSAPMHTAKPPQGIQHASVRFLKMVMRGDFPTIRKKIQSKYRRWKHQVDPNQNKAEKELQHLVNVLNEIYVNYNWKQHQGDALFIRSTEFARRPDKAYHLTQWNTLISGSLQVVTVPGHHLTLFEEPEVAGLASAINGHLLQKSAEGNGAPQDEYAPDSSQ